MDRDKRPRRRLRSLLPRETGPRKPRRRSLARQEPPPEPEEPRAVWIDLHDVPAGRYRDGYGWRPCGGDMSTGEITFMTNRRDQ